MKLAPFLLTIISVAGLAAAADPDLTKNNDANNRDNTVTIRLSNEQLVSSHPVKPHTNETAFEDYPIKIDGITRKLEPYYAHSDLTRDGRLKATLLTVQKTPDHPRFKCSLSDDKKKHKGSDVTQTQTRMSLAERGKPADLQDTSIRCSAV